MSKPQDSEKTLRLEFRFFAALRMTGGVRSYFITDLTRSIRAWEGSEQQS